MRPCNGAYACLDFAEAGVRVGGGVPLVGPVGGSGGGEETSQ